MITIKFDTSDLDSEDKRYFTNKEVKAEGYPETIDEYVPLFRAFLAAMTFSQENIDKIIKDPEDEECDLDKIIETIKEILPANKRYKMDETAG